MNEKPTNNAAPDPAASSARQGDADESERALSERIARDPDADADAARLELALLRLQRGDYRQAHELTLQACRQRLHEPQLLRERLQALRVFHEHALMRDLQAACPPAAEHTPADLRAVAAALQSAGLTAEALHWAEAAVAGAPSDPLARTQLGLLCIDAGQLDRARDLLRPVCEGTPVPIAHWALARLEGAEHSQTHIDTLRRLLATQRSDPQGFAFIGFALQRRLEALGRHDEAYTVLQQASQAKRATVHYHEAEDIALLKALQAEPQLPPNRSPLDPEAACPIFIVGMHRSGTSLLERMLEGHPQIAAGGESYRLSAQARLAANCGSRDVLSLPLLRALRGIDPAALAHGYLQANAWLSAGHSHFTDKLPQNFWLTGLIARCLPQARVLHLVRDPVDTCASNLCELFGGANAPYSYRPDELARAYARYQTLMAHWHRQHPGFVLDVSYEALVSEPEPTLQRVFAHCGLSYTADALDIRARRSPARSASNLQVRQPIHTASIGGRRASTQLTALLRQHLRAAGVELGTS